MRKHRLYSMVISTITFIAIVISGWIILSPTPVVARRMAKCSTECPDGSILSCEGNKCETKAEKEYAKDPICIVDDTEITKCSDKKKEKEKKDKKKDRKKDKNANGSVNNSNTPAVNANIENKNGE